MILSRKLIKKRTVTVLFLKCNFAMKLAAATAAVVVVVTAATNKT